MALMLVLVGAAAAPTAAGDDHQCWINVEDPTNPMWSDACTEPPDLEREPGNVPAVTVIFGTEYAFQQIDDAANICDTPAPCNEMLEASLSSDAHVSEDVHESLELSADLTVAGNDAEAGTSPEGCSGDAIVISLTRLCEKVPNP